LLKNSFLLQCPCRCKSG